MRISDWSSDVCSSDLIEVGFFLHHPGQWFTFPEALGARGHLAGVMGIAAEHPDGRHDRDETAVAGIVEHPADLLDLFADLDRKDRKSTRLQSRHYCQSRLPSSA